MIYWRAQYGRVLIHTLFSSPHPPPPPPSTPSPPLYVSLSLSGPVGLLKKPRERFLFLDQNVFVTSYNRVEGVGNSKAVEQRSLHVQS